MKRVHCGSSGLTRINVRTRLNYIAHFSIVGMLILGEENEVCVDRAV